MYATSEQFAAAGKAGFESFFNVASTGLAGFEKLVALNIGNAKAMFDDAAVGARVALAARDPKELLSQGANATQPAFEKSLAWSREVYGIVTDTQAAVRAAAEEQSAAVQKEFSAVLEKTLASAPPGSESAVAALRSALTGATAAYDNAAKIARQAFDTAEANFSNAANSAVANVTAATKAAGKRK